jgi:hypothetical protein
MPCSIGCSPRGRANVVKANETGEATTRQRRDKPRTSPYTRAHFPTQSSGAARHARLEEDNMIDIRTTA